MAWTQDDRERLRKAIASGIQEVAYTDRRVKYRSLEEMKEALRLMDEELENKKKCHRVYMNGWTGIRS